ncbi:MAG: polysaccharide deacetylase family protein [Angelakisella sp.]
MKIFRLAESAAAVLLSIAVTAQFVATGQSAVQAATALSATTAVVQTGVPVKMAVLMYHSVNSNDKRSGEYVITPAALRCDLAYLQSQGYQTITMTELIDFVHNGVPLPPKPVMLTFDDGYYNNYLHAFSLLREYHAKAVISIIGAETDKFSQLEENNQNYSHLTWTQITEMQQSGLVEFQNHSYNLHKTLQSGRQGTMRKKGEPTEQYQKMLTEDLQKLQERYNEMTGWTPNTFAYPFGRISKESYPVVTKLGFAASLDVQGRPYIATPGQESCLFRIPRYNRTSHTSAKEILQMAMTDGKKGGGG